MPNRFRYLIPSIADVIFLVLFITLSLLIPWKLLLDCDTGYHIRTGEYILQHWTIPHHDIFSFLNPPPRWVAFEWLSQVIMALIHQLAGLTGIVIFFAFLISLTYYYLFKFLQKENINIFISIIIIMLVITSSSIHWLARPHIFSLLLFLIWYHILCLYQYHNKNYLYFLPPLMLLWVNLHGAFFLGILLLIVYLAGNGIRILIPDKVESNQAKTKAKTLALCSGFTIIISLINPNGYINIGLPFELLSNQFIINHISEFQSPNFHENDLLAFEILILLIFFILSVSMKKLNIIEIALMILFAHMSLYSVRNIPLFAIIAAPIISKQFQYVFDFKYNKFADFLRNRHNNISTIDNTAKGILWILLPIFFISYLTIMGFLNYRFDENIKPIAAVEFLKKVKIKGHLYNLDEFGDYIIYKAYPDYQVFIDGRMDMYGANWFKKYYQISNFKPGWEDTLEKYQINVIFFNTDSALSRFLLERDEWRLIYSDKVASIFIKNVNANRNLIEKHKDITLYITKEDDNGK
jgi:hypothetical protein